MNDMRKILSPMATLALLILAVPVVATAEWDLSATIELETRLFAGDAAYPGQHSDRGQFALAAIGEIRWRDENGGQRASIIPRFRRDTTDPERNLVDFGENYWAWEGRSSELLIGANTEFWGVAESVHLVDIINQTDSASDIDGEDKLGQPMVNLVMRRDWGELGFYAMPYFRDRTFAGSNGRLRGPLPVDTDRAVYESSAGRKHLDVAFRYSHFIGAVDIGVSAFSGTSREPRLIPDADALRPYYDQIEQAGVDLQYTGDAWLWKFEGIVRNGYADTFFAAVGGFEYTIYQVADSAADIGMILEYQYDGRASSEPVVLSDNDVFAGTRLALNDTQDTSVLAGAGVDLDTGAVFMSVEAERRIGNDYVLEFTGRAFADAQFGKPDYWLADDDYVQIQLRRFF